MSLHSNITCTYIWLRRKQPYIHAYYSISTIQIYFENLSTVLQIHDILGWIRIRIRGSMPLTNGSGSCYFRQWPSRCQQETNFFSQFFCLLLFECTFTSLFKDKKSKRVAK
jgi:hypothetical protein